MGDERQTQIPAHPTLVERKAGGDEAWHGGPAMKRYYRHRGRGINSALQTTKPPPAVKPAAVPGPQYSGYFPAGRAPGILWGSGQRFRHADHTGNDRSRSEGHGRGLRRARTLLRAGKEGARGGAAAYSQAFQATQPPALTAQYIVQRRIQLTPTSRMASRKNLSARSRAPRRFSYR